MEESRRAPVLIAISEYLKKNFMSVILDGLHERLSSGALSKLLGSTFVVEPISEDMCSFDDTKCYWHSQTSFYADLTISALLHVKDEDGNEVPEYACVVVTLFVTFLAEERSCEIYHIRNFGEPPTFETEVALDDWLVPKLTWENVEIWADNIWFRYDFAALNDARLRTPYSLVSKMGLKVEKRDLSKDVSSVRLYLAGSEKSRQWGISQDTIILNINGYDSNDVCARKLYKCCISYEWHYLFYMLQGMCYASPWAIPYRDAAENEDVIEGPQSYMDSQLSHGDVALMIPRDFLQQYIDTHMEEAGRIPRSHNYAHHMAARLEQIGHMLSNEYHLCKGYIRTRMLHLQYKQARGIFNWADGHYTRAFAADEERLRIKDACYSIYGRVRAIDLFCENKDFRECVSTGDFVYADGLIVQAQDGTLETDEERGLVPSAIVNSRVNDYCLRLHCHYEPGSGYHYSFSKAVVNELRSYQHRPEDYQQDVEWMTAMPDFHTLLSELIERNTTVQQLSNETLVSQEEIRSLCETERLSYAPMTLLHLCIGLRLRPQLSEIVFKKAGIDLRKEENIGLHATLCLFYLDDLQTMLIHITGRLRFLTQGSQKAS